MKKRSFLAIPIAMAVLVTAMVGQAFAGAEYNSKLPASKKSLSCNACHTSSLPNLNQWGKDWVAAGKDYKKMGTTTAPKTTHSKTTTTKAAPKTTTTKAKTTKVAAKPAAPQVVVKPAPRDVDLVVFNQSGKGKVVYWNNTPYMAVKDLADLYGKPAHWEKAKKSIHVKVKDFEFKGTLNKKEAVVNGKNVTLADPVRMINGRVVISVESLGLAVGAGKDVSADKIVVTPQVSSVEVASLITAEWKTTGKTFANASPAGRGIGCAKCHDGYGFVEQTKYLAAADTYKPAHFTGIDCQSCHSGFGKETMEKGTVKVLFSKEPIVAGKGAVCIACHNSNRDPVATFTESAERKITRLSYPHYGMQGALFTGLGGMEYPDAKYESTAAHASIKDSCVACHMPKTQKGYMQHTFGMDKTYIAQQCGTCHTGITDYAPKKKEEIKKMLEKLHAAILEKTGAATIEMGGGQFTFKTADGKAIEPKNISHEAYVAVYNWRLVKYDGSYGIHNPKYAKSLLEVSYERLTGQALK